MTCKNCICYDACHYHIDEETTMTVNECSTGFKSKDQYVRLPAYVGQQVWNVRTLHKYIDKQFKVVGYEVESGRVSMLQQKVDKSWKIRVTIGSSVSDYTLDEFTKHLFTNLEDAEAEAFRREQELTNG